MQGAELVRMCSTLLGHNAFNAKLVAFLDQYDGRVRIPRQAVPCALCHAVWPPAQGTCMHTCEAAAQC
jgi:hypothetical protein